MIPDPNTEEGRKEIALRAKKRVKEINEVKKRANRDIDDEPFGKMTKPNDIDRTKDRKNNDE